MNVAAIQYAPPPEVRAAIALAAEKVREAAAAGAQIILLPELFSGPYFCKRQAEAEFARAHEWQQDPAVRALAPLAEELGVVLPVSIFEREGPHYYNSVVMLDADGRALGVYRKSHIPDGPGYQEKFYFRPGGAAPRVWQTRHGRIGVGICWDQWFPEAARLMALQDADILLYPSAIGAEPQDPGLDTAARWRRVMVGHAVANTVPVCAANRIGTEAGQAFYGTSFIADPAGEIVADAGRDAPAIIQAEFNLEAIARERAAWGFFRDRRPDLYARLVERS